MNVFQRGPETLATLFFCPSSGPKHNDHRLTPEASRRLTPEADTWPDIVSGCCVGKRVVSVLVQVDKLGCEFFCSYTYSEHVHRAPLKSVRHVFQGCGGKLFQMLRK